MLLRLIGITLIILPFIPFNGLLFPTDRYPNLNSFDYRQPGYWLTSLTILLGATILLSFLIKKLESHPNQQSRLFKHFKFNDKFSIALILIITLQIALLASYCFGFQPGLIDSIAQVFQAKIFASGNLVVNHPENLEFFVNQNFVYHQGNWSAQYPPGHSLILSIGELFQLRWLTPLLLSAGSAYYIYRITNLLYNQKTAQISLILLAFSPFFLLMGASQMNHVTTLFLLSSFYFYLLSWNKKKLLNYLLIASCLLGLAVITRPLTALLAVIPLLPLTLKNIFLGKEIRGLILSSIIFSGLIFFWLAFNQDSTGEYFLSGYTKNWGKLHGLGFHETPWGDYFNWQNGLLNQLLNLLALNSQLFTSLLPASYPIAIWLLFNQKLSSPDKILFSLIISFIVGHTFYWHTDFYLGPRYWYSMLIALIPLTARSLLAIYQLSLKYNLKLLMLSLALTSLLAQVLIGYPDKLHSTRENTIAGQQGWTDSAPPNSLIFVKVSWAHRVVSNLLGQGVPASLTEKAYKKVGLCQLDTLISSASTKKELIKKLQKLVGQDLPTKKFAISNTPPVRFNLPLKLTKKCQNEISYDAANDFTVYAYYFLKNDALITKNSSRIFAKDLRQKNITLIKKFPNHQLYYLTTSGLNKFD